MWISCWWQGAGLTALETEILYLSTGQVQHRQRQCELSPHHPVHVPQPWPGGTTSRGERGCSVSKAHSILPPQPRLPTRGGPVALVIFVLWTPPVHGDLDWPPHLISHRLRSPPDGNTNSFFFFSLFFFLFLFNPFSLSPIPPTPFSPSHPHLGTLLGVLATVMWEASHPVNQLLLSSLPDSPCPPPHCPKDPAPFLGGYGVGGGGRSGSCKCLLWRGGGRKQDLEHKIFSFFFFLYVFLWSAP